MCVLRRATRLGIVWMLFVSVLDCQPNAPESKNLTPAEILKNNNLSVALIVSADDNSLSLGSGFAIADGSAIVTNFHVIKAAKALVVKLGGGQILQTSTVYAFDTKKDLAILKVSPAATRSVEMGNSDKVSIGEPVVVISNPEGLEKSVTNGLVSGVRTPETGRTLFQISAPVSPGSSGGPVFNERGQVIGVVVSFLEGGQNLNFAIPINNVQDLWSKRNEISLASLPASLPPDSDVDSQAAGASVDLDGNWAATFADSLSSGQLSFILVQTRTSVRGTYTSSLGGGGTINGSIAGGKFSFELAQTIRDCPGRFRGEADIRSGSMVGTYTGTDCQGTHTNGSFGMSKGAVAIQSSSPVVSNANANPPMKTEYGNASELKGVQKVFVYTQEDPGVRGNMLKELAKHPAIQVTSDIGSADVVLVFGARTFSMGNYSHVWSDSYGNVYGNSYPRYGITGNGYAIKFIPPNTMRIVWEFSATRTVAFQRRPSTNFIRDFAKAWEKANK